LFNHLISNKKLTFKERQVFEPKDEYKEQ